VQQGLPADGGPREAAFRHPGCSRQKHQTFPIGRVVEKSRIPTALLGLQSSRGRDSDCISGSTCPEVDISPPYRKLSHPSEASPIIKIAACLDYPLFRWHSNEGVPIEGAMMGREWLQVLHRQMEKPRDLGDKFFLHLRALLHGILAEIADRKQMLLLLDRDLPLDRSNEPRSVFREIGFLLATYFGAQMF